MTIGRTVPTTLVCAFSGDIVAVDSTLDSNEFTVTNATFSSASISANTRTFNLIGAIDQSVVCFTLNGINDTNNYNPASFPFFRSKGNISICDVRFGLRLERYG